MPLSILSYAPGGNGFCPVRPSQANFSEKARSMAATSARLALFWGLRVSRSPEELPMIPVPTAQDRASLAQSLAWLKSL